MRKCILLILLGTALLTSVIPATSKSRKIHRAVQTPRKADQEIVVPMRVDVDGAPKAYGPRDRDALDFKLNARENAKPTGRIVGYLIDSHGKPIIQGPNDPAPGFFISTTGYKDKNNPNEKDPRKYVNAAEINYTVLARSAANKGVKLGDFCVVHSVTKNKTVFAIVGDSGNSSGKEGSLALLQRLGFRVKSGKSVDEAITKVVVRYFANTNPNGLFFFNQSDLDDAGRGLNLDTDFSSFHRH